MTFQASCIDCNHKHRPSKCPHRVGRIGQLRQRIKESQRELDDLVAYDEQIKANPESEGPTRLEVWRASHA